MTTVQQVPLGVFGGSGFYEFLDDAQEMLVDTPYGPPAGPVVVGSVAGHSVAFMARHGRNHQFAAHRVPYRANMWALHSVGVRSIVAPCSVGSLQPEIHPGQLVVVDQGNADHATPCGSGRTASRCRPYAPPCAPACYPNARRVFRTRG